VRAPGPATRALGRLGPPAALLLLVAAVLPGLLRGETLYLRDINMVWLPQVESFVRAIADGAPPLWDPHSGFGRPLWADPRAEILYPPTWLNLLMRPATYYALFVVGHLLLAGAGMWRLARHDGMEPVAAAAAAGAWAASGPLLSLVSMWHHLAAAAWVPWVVLSFETVAARPGPRAVAWAAAALAAQVLAGSPDVTALTLLIVTVRLVPTIARMREGRGTRVALVAGAGALALVLTAAQWLPTLDVVRRSTRWLGAAGAAASTWSLHPLALPELLLPVRWADFPLTAAATLALLEGKEPWMRSVYLGAPAAALVAAGLAAGRPRRGSLVVLLLLGVGLALGAHGPLYPLAAALPGAGALRFPVKALLVAAFAWGLLAGAGVEALGEGSRRARSAALATALALAGAGLVAWALARTAGAGEGVLGSLLASPLPAWIRAPIVVTAGLTIALAALAWARERLGPRRAAMGAVVLAVADLAWRHHALNPTAPRALFEARPEALRLLDTAGGGRTYVYDYSIDPGLPGRAHPYPYRLARVPEGWTTSAGLVLGVHAYLNPPTAARWQVAGSYDLDILGFDPAPLDRLTRFVREREGTPAHLRLLQLGAVASVMALEPAAWWQDLGPAAVVPGFFEQPIRIFRVPDPLPRAYVVDGVRVADGEQALRTLVDPSLDPRREIVLAEGEPRPPGTGPAGTARLSGQGWDAEEVDADLQRDAYLVLVDAYDPGWRAIIDGRSARVHRANMAFRAVAVPAGRHHVRLEYRPPALARGLALSALGLSALAVLVLRSGRARANGLAGRPEPC